MKYTLIKHKKSFYTDSPSEFIKWMRKKDLQLWENNQEFMEGYAYRKKTFENINIRTDNELVFIEDLQKNNLLKVEHSKGLLSYIKRILPD